ncbi:MAG: leucine-rich repeat protein [Clostridia bacterium]|nr:leucine-rich repeat protein [Clostridia bacterium]
MKNTRKVLAIIMVVAMCFSMFSHTAFANATTIAEGTAGESVTWVLTDDGVLTISGTGAMNTDWYSPPWKEYNESITEVVVEEGITKIPNTAFCYAENLVTITVPSTVTEIESFFVWGNYSLESINVAEDNTVYKDIDGVLFTEDEKTIVTYPMNKAGAEYTIPASVETIGAYAFLDNVSLKSVVVPDTVTSLGGCAFEYSTIDSINLGNGITEIPYSCFAHASVKSIVIPDSVKTIGQSAFWDVDELETLIIGSGVETIDSYIFEYTDALSVIHYKGTQEDWDAISIHEENEGLNSKELHFISGEIKEGTEPTCVDGHTAGIYCDTCEAYLTGEVIEAVDEHNYDDGVVYGPYCTADGYTLYTCTVCGDGYTDNETEMTGHAIGDDGLCETCGEECEHADEEINGKCDYCGFEFDYEEIYFEEINTVHIPEEHVPVIVKFTSTINGWLVLVSDNGGDDENNDPYVEVYDSNGDYVEDDDDHDYNDSLNFYCEFEAEAGETYYIALYSYDSDVEYDYIVTKHVGIDHQPTAAEPYVTLTWDVEAEYQWYLLDGDEEVAIDGETEATLKNPKIGSEYGCLVTYNGVEIYSDILFYGYAITHQPTAKEPYVELNDDTDATYQWYSAKEANVELTDENTIPFPSEDEGPVYDAEKGWSNGVYVGRLEGTYEGYVYFITSLKADDIMSIELSGDYYSFVAIIDSFSFNIIDEIDVDENGKCEFTAKEDGDYSVVAFRPVDGDEVFVKAYMDGYEYTKIEGATSAEYTPTEDGLYACEVTFADDTTEMSRVFEKKTAPAGEDDNTGGNAGENTGNNTGDNTGSNADNDESTKPAPKPEIPNTDATVNNANSNGWFAVMLTLSMGLVLVMTTSKKRVSSK